MPTSARRRRPVDVERLSRAVSRPGIDPRAWVATARVDDTGEAVRWSTEAGWVIDVTFYGGALDQQGEVPCRALNRSGGGDGYGEYYPPTIGCEALVVIPDGAPDAGPVVLGGLDNGDGCVPPSTINGLPISGDLLASVPLVGPVSPFDTEIIRSPHNRREEHDGERTIQAALVALLAGQVVVGAPPATPGVPAAPGDVRLGSIDAIEPALLGLTTNANLSELIAGLQAMATVFQAMTGPLVPFQAVGTALAAVCASVLGKLPAQLASGVKVA